MRSLIRSPAILSIRKSEEGASLVEAAIMLPVFLILILVVIDCALLLTEKVVLRQAVQETGRMGAVLVIPCPFAPTSDESTALVNRFTRELSGYVIKPALPSLVATVMPGTGANSLLELTASAQGNCLVCGIFGNLIHRIELHSAGVFLLEHSCPP